jgi:hypothetical protein
VFKVTIFFDLPYDERNPWNWTQSGKKFSKKLALIRWV